MLSNPKPARSIVSMLWAGSASGKEVTAPSEQHRAHVIPIKGDCHRLEDKRKAGALESKNVSVDKAGGGQK